jgi:hypothetical protein
MLYGETYKEEQARVLIGRFSNHQEVYQAQEILTDFGYPKEATNVMEVPGRRVNTQIIKVTIIAAIVGAILIGGALIYLSLEEVLSLPDIGVVLALWAIFLSLGVVACCFVGALLWSMIDSFIAKKHLGLNQEPGKESVNRENVLVSVKPRTPAEAKEIAHEWRNIGGKMVS